MLHPRHDQFATAVRPARTPRWSPFAIAVTLAAFLAAWSVLPAPVEAATTYWVEEGGTGADCTEADPCGTIAAALVEAGDGDTIMIADGTYTEPGLEIADAVTLQGASTTGTVIQAHEDKDAATDRVMHVLENAGTVGIHDVTIRHGRTTTASFGGGGIRIESGNTVTVTTASIVDNATTANGSGGGIFNSGDLTVEYSTISRNYAADSGGGIINSGELTVRGATIAGNTAARFGGGVYNYGHATIEAGSVIGGDTPTEGNTARTGGGISNSESLIVTASAIAGNKANSDGGGIANEEGVVTLTEAVITENEAEGDGGGIHNRYVDIFNLVPATVKTTASVIAANTAANGGGVFTLTDSRDPADAVVNISHSIVAGNAATVGPAIVSRGTTTAVHNWWGDAAGPVPGTIVDTDPSLSTTTFDPWLTSLELIVDPTDATEGDPVEVTATLRDSSPGGDASEHLAVRFSHSSGLPDADVPFASPAVHAFDAAAGDDTITGTVLFAGQESTLTGSTLVTATPLPPAPRDLPSGPPTTTLVEDDREFALADGCFEEAVVPASGDLMLSTYDDCGNVEVTAPEGSLPSGHTLVLGVPADLDDLPTANGDAAHRLAFILQLQDEDGEVVTGDLDGPVTVTVGIPPEPVHPNELLVSYWDGEAWVDMIAEVVEAADGSVTLTFEVDHFTLFATQEDPGRGQLTPEPASSGTSLAQWGGGPTSLLPAAKSYWVTSEGRFLAYSPGGPSFVNEAFLSQWPDGGIPEGTLLIVVR